MSYDIILKNGLVVTPTGVIQGGVAIAGEQIVAIGADADSVVIDPEKEATLGVARLRARTPRYGKGVR